MCIVNLVVIAFFIPAFLLATALAFSLYYYFQKTYRPVARELRRIDSVTRSPVIAMLTESLTGIPTIRAFGTVDQFVSRNLTLLDSNNKAQQIVLLSQRWIQVHN
jgi:ATP-binding cassette subfamily C (CFTR/MRP) protein 1